MKLPTMVGGLYIKAVFDSGVKLAAMRLKSRIVTVVTALVEPPEPVAVSVYVVVAVG